MPGFAPGTDGQRRTCRVVAGDPSLPVRAADERGPGESATVASTGISTRWTQADATNQPSAVPEQNR